MRQPGGGFVRTADRLAVGVSQLTRPDSFHAGSRGSQRQDQVRFRLFDVAVAFVFEGGAQLARVCFWKPVGSTRLSRRRCLILPITDADHVSPRLLSFYTLLSDPNTRFSHQPLLVRKYKSFLILWAAGRSDDIFFAALVRKSRAGVLAWAPSPLSGHSLTAPIDTLHPAVKSGVLLKCVSA